MLLLASIVVFLLLVLNGLFAMSELAVVSSRRSKLQSRADRGDLGAAAALRLSEDPTRFLAAVQVGITLIGILAGAFGQATVAAELDKLLHAIPAIQNYSELIATGIVVVVLTYFSLVVGELVPKRFAMAFPETIAASIARPLTFMSRMLGPFISLLTFSTSGVLRMMSVKDQHGEEITHDEVRTALAEGTSAGLIEPAEQAMIGEVMLLGDRAVRVAMTSRRDIHWISLLDAPEQQMADIRACPYSRIVVVQGPDVDEPVGVIHKKDVLDAMLDGAALNLSELMVTPVYIGETTTVLKAFDLLKRTPLHMALVIDEFGALEGIVTATDLLEMIAGDFDEAHDQDTPGTIIERADGSYLVDGRVEVDVLARRLKMEFDESRHFQTVAGLLLSVIGHLPEQGEIYRIGSFDVEIIDMDARRIDKLLFYKRDKPVQDQEPDRPGSPSA